MTYFVSYRVIFSDTDAGGIVYHARYFEMAEIGRNELMRSVGVPSGGFEFVPNKGLVVASAQMKFLSPAIMDDKLTITTSLSKLSHAKTQFDTKIMREKCRTRICELSMEFVCVDRVKKQAVLLPDEIYAPFSKLIAVNVSNEGDK